jgi:hypothetical protein
MEKPRRHRKRTIALTSGVPDASCGVDAPGCAGQPDTHQNLGFTPKKINLLLFNSPPLRYVRGNLLYDTVNNKNSEQNPDA